jgi:phytoene synthase
MALATAIETNERRFCWEQVLRTNRVFRISQVFAPAGQSSRLLPLYALFSAVEEVGWECSDTEVARRKLDWWRSECARLAGGDSDHPILRELSRSGAHEALCRESLRRLFDNAESRLDAAAPADTDQLRELCRQLSQPQIALELSLWGGGRPSPELVNDLGTAIGLAQLLRESASREPSRRYGWLPLNLLARHGVKRDEIARNPRAEPVRTLFAEVLKESYGPGLRAGAWREPGEPDRTEIRHLFVISHLQACALRRLIRSQPDRFTHELSRVGFPQLYQAWKAARVVTRP